MDRPIPTSKTATKYAKALGGDAWEEYKNLRTHYQGEGLTPKDAYKRAFVELKIGERYEDLKRRRALGVISGSSVALTPAEVEEIYPGYQRPGRTNAKDIGDLEMSHSEQVLWAKKMVARVTNGEDPPVKFPNEGALFWYQTAVGNRDKFLTILQKVEGASGDQDNQYMQDSQYQYSEIEKQLREALRETGERFREIESDFLEQVES